MTGYVTSRLDDEPEQSLLDPDHVADVKSHV